MENDLYTPKLGDILAELQAINSELLTPGGLTWQQGNALNSRMFKSLLKLAEVVGGLGYYEREFGSFRELCFRPVAAEPAPGLPAITLPKGVTLEAFADNILPRHEEKRGIF
jgi:hypothetical protein